MSNNKQILEMAAIIFENISYEASTQDSVDAAEALYNAGYRKVPEGAIILTKEERAALNEYQKKLDAGGDPFEKEQKE